MAVCVQLRKEMVGPSSPSPAGGDPFDSIFSEVRAAALLDHNSRGSLVLLAETGLAVSAMTPSIIIIVAMLPMFLFLGVMILRQGLLRRKSYKSSYDHERQCSHVCPPMEVYAK